MKFCQTCGQPLADDVKFCATCGAKAPSVPAYFDPIQAEQEFLETTHRILRWERKAWSITGKASLIIGCVFGALFWIIGLIFMALEGDAAFLGIFYATYGSIYAAIFIVQGIIALVNANKIPYYMDTLYSDFSIARKRCTSGGMGAVNILFCGISAIFFFMNLSRINNSKATVERILARQRGQ